MALPKQVEEDLKRIEEIESHLKAPESPGDTLDEDIDTDVKSEETAEVVTEPTVTEVTDDFQQKYSTLRGKYDAEVPRLHAQVKELSVKLETLNAQMLAKAEEKPVVEEPVSYVTDADKEEYGEDLLAVQKRVAQEVGAQYEVQLKQQASMIENLTSKVEGNNSQVNDMTFDQALHRAIPDFASINNDPAWVAWLNEHDPILRGPRRNVAQQAFETNDIEAIAEYVQMFKATLAPVEELVDTRKKELEKQVTPTRNASGTHVPTDGSKKVYTPKQADKVWEKVRQLNQNASYEEATKLEAEISVAYVEGRVR